MQEARGTITCSLSTCCRVLQVAELRLTPVLGKARQCPT